MKTSEQINEISKALATAQGLIRAAEEDSKNPHYKSSYSSLTAVWDAIRVPLSSNGISVVQDVTLSDGCVAVTTRLCHASGQWIDCGPMLIPIVKRDAHGVGSAATYAKRYSLCATVGVVSGDDDDGNAATDSSARPLQGPISDMQQRQLIEAAGDRSDLLDLVVQRAKISNISQLNSTFFPGTLKWIQKEVRKAIEES